MTPTTRTSKLPSLDGWRAISIALVLLAHSSYTAGFPNRFHAVSDVFHTGTLGVRFFFVISGFLITWLLLQEQKQIGRINLTHFYVRRAVRILPVCFLYLLVVALFTKYSQSALAWIANLTFITNFYFTPWTTGHLWSLGVEEQFYLLWPCLLVWQLQRKDAGQRLIKILLIPLVVAPIVRMLSCKQWYPDALHFLFQSFSFFYCFDFLAYGCLAAILVYYRPTELKLFFQKNRRLIAVGGLSMIVVPFGLMGSPIPQRIKDSAFDSMEAIGFGLILVQSILYPTWGWYRGLNWRWVRHIGVLSYSIYIWQQLFCGPDESIFGVTNAWWLRFPMWILTALLAAHASYYLLEKPLLKLRARLHAA